MPDHIPVYEPWKQSPKFGGLVLPHTLYSLDLALSDYHLFGTLKDGIYGTKFDDVPPL
jgi:hypothetical protein